MNREDIKQEISDIKEIIRDEESACKNCDDSECCADCSVKGTTESYYHELAELEEKLNKN